MTQRGTAALIVAAGQGVRSGSTLPKQFALLAGKPMIAHSHAALAGHPQIDQIMVVVGEGQAEALNAALGDVRHVPGGATRRMSVRAGLEALAATAPERVLIHDAARPFLSAAIIDRLLGALAANDGSVPALPIADTLARGDGLLGDVVPRDGLHRIQTPQAFRFETIIAAHRGWSGGEPTDDAQMVRATGGTVALVEGDIMLEKITYPADFAAAEMRHAAAMRVRSATGFDVHRLVEGEQLWLGGVLVPHDKGLSGHSDADVALHAITDALLGTIGDGDIGMHFPPSDPKWRGADSAQFLQHAAELVAGRGGIIDFVDLTIICEAPKIGPHREAMRRRIAALLRLTPGQISVKATTTERLGFAGRGEGIAAQAIATIRIPGDAA
ncbi:MAG: bifunctional 2-C-methyl-D-erythritol 4-phosphate cytidylyltransferase/2-C-methyl-D-erythritol 2,4-cyclodiphosphate synthase [Pseudomonadota bacterium]